MPRFNPVSISGYHIREAGSTAVQELAFTLADGFGYVQACLERGLDVDSFAPRLSFFFDIHNDFFEEIAKLRAARRIWATVMRDRFGARKPESMRLRTHTQTAGVSADGPAAAQQRGARGACRRWRRSSAAPSRCTPTRYDEVLALPTEQAVTIALRTQQIIAEETGAPLTDRSAGRLLLPGDAHRSDGSAGDVVHPEDRRAGRDRAAPSTSATRSRRSPTPRTSYQLMDDRGDRTVVGVNKYVMPGRASRSSTCAIDDAVEREQIERVKRVKAARDSARVERRLAQLTDACRDGGNVMPVLVDAVKDYVSVGEISDVYREVFGRYREPIHLLKPELRVKGDNAMSEAIRVTKATSLKPKPKDAELGFGQIFTDHMFVADFQEEKGWYDPRVEPYGPLSLDPAAAVLHYAQSIFDGLKAFRGVDGKVRLFRPQKHVERMTNSAKRLCIPPIDPDHGARLDRDAGRRRARLGAEDGGHLALHPPDGHRQRAVPRRPSGEDLRVLRHPVARGRLLSRGDGAGEDPRGRQVRASRGRRRGRRQDGRPTTRPASTPARRPSTPASRKCSGSTACTESTSTRSGP